MDLRLRRTRHVPQSGFAGSRHMYGLVLPGIIRALTFSLSVFLFIAETGFS